MAQRGKSGHWIRPLDDTYQAQLMRRRQLTQTPSPLPVPTAYGQTPVTQPPQYRPSGLPGRRPPTEQERLAAKARAELPTPVGDRRVLDAPRGSAKKGRGCGSTLVWIAILAFVFSGPLKSCASAGLDLIRDQSGSTSPESVSVKSWTYAPKAVTCDRAQVEDLVSPNTLYGDACVVSLDITNDANWQRTPSYFDFKDSRTGAYPSYLLMTGTMSRAWSTPLGPGETKQYLLPFEGVSELSEIVVLTGGEETSLSVD